MGTYARRVLWSVFVFGVLIILGCSVAWFSSGGLRYQGKSLEEWMERSEDESLRQAERDQAQIAVNHIVTNNLPTLLKWFCEEEPEHSYPAYIDFVNKLLSHQNLLGFRLVSAERRSPASAAVAVFEEHPEISRTILPAFIGMLTNKSDEVKGNACRVLVKIGEPAIPRLTPLLSSRNDVTRLMAITTLGEVGLDDLPLRPRFEAMTCDSSVPVRLCAAEALRKFGEDSEFIVPVIMQCYREGEPATRQQALYSLLYLRSRARSALPMLTNAIATTTNTDDHSLLLNLLREIAPREATNYGLIPRWHADFE